MVMLPKIFDRDPALKARVEAWLESLPAKKKEEDFRQFERFIKGEITWAELKGYPQSFLKLLTQTSYMIYKSGDLGRAEILFKGLAIIDHTNWYYRSVLGSIYQKQKQYTQAIDEYGMALSLNEKEIASLTNRGECYWHLNNQANAEADWKLAIQLDPQLKTPWGKRASTLLNKVAHDPVKGGAHG